jgi:hypothetical protein
VLRAAQGVSACQKSLQVVQSCEGADAAHSLDQCEAAAATSTGRGGRAGRARQTAGGEHTRRLDSWYSDWAPQATHAPALLSLPGVVAARGAGGRRR